MDALGYLGAVAKFALLLAGLLGPGAAVMRALRLPSTVAPCFAGSAVALYVIVLALQLASVPISLGSLTAGLGTITLVAALIGWGRDALVADCGGNATGASRPQPEKAAVGHRGIDWRQFRQMGAWTPLYALFWAAFLLRAWREPLPGPDIGFRWGFLAEQMLGRGTLDFYPPRSAADFLAYFWVESIPPGVSALHAWAFACAGRANYSWAAVAVVLQIWALHDLLWRTAGQIGGARAAHFACLAAAACPLLTWSFLLGQETGLTTLSLVGIAFALQGWQRHRAPAWAALAGIFAMLGAAAREYGLVFPALACAGLALLRADRRSWLAFGGVAVLAILWPARVFILTGNPFYSLALGGFPSNARFLDWIEHDAAALGNAVLTIAGWRDVVRHLIFFAPGALIGGAVLIAAARRRNRSAWWALTACLVVAVLWLISVRYTNGGLFYSLRVLSPVFGLCALAAGIGFASLTGRRSVLFANTLLTGVLLGTVCATLALPRNPWRTPVSAWSAFAARTNATTLSESLGLVRQAGGKHRASLRRPRRRPRVSESFRLRQPARCPALEPTGGLALRPVASERGGSASMARFGHPPHHHHKIPNESGFFQHSLPLGPATISSPDGR
ncbi:MAG: hypothetical protein EXS37_20615 [Opitutus sp.]|nr:hypothetical protein [Opitutus sp.]